MNHINVAKGRGVNFAIVPAELCLSPWKRGRLLPWFGHPNWQYQTISPRVFDYNTSFSLSILNFVLWHYHAQKTTKSAVYLAIKLPFLPPPFAAESLSSPFAILSLALWNLSLSFDRLLLCIFQVPSPKLPFLTPPFAAESLSSPFAILSLALSNLSLSFDYCFSTQPFQSIAKTSRYAELLSASPFVHAFLGSQIQLKLSPKPCNEKSSAQAPSTVFRDHREPFPFDWLYEVFVRFYRLGQP